MPKDNHLLKQLFTPRTTATLWAIYAATTSYGYWGKSVDALTPVESILPSSSPALAWAVTAVILTIGVLAPDKQRWAATGRICRLTGITIAGALLAMWAGSYFYDAIAEHSRMWVSGKNYVMLTIAAMASGSIMGRTNI